MGKEGGGSQESASKPSGKTWAKERIFKYSGGTTPDATAEKKSPKKRGKKDSGGKR